MTRKGRTLQRPYQEALRRYLKQGLRASVYQAQRLGCQAVGLGLETLDLAQIHGRAMVSALDALPADSVAAREAIIKRAGKFFGEAILPLEATHRTALTVTGHLSELNEALSRRTRDLSASNRKLRREIAKRSAVEKSLRTSEKQSTRLLEQSRYLQEQLRLLSRRILSAQEEERRRISRELHDVIAQMLTGITVRLATLKVDAAASIKGFGLKISRTQRLVERSVDIVHQFARELRPAVLDDLGLIPAVHSFLKGFAGDTGIRVNLTAFAGVETLGIDQRTALYRVTQEAVANVARHAQASRVDVSIRRLPHAVRMQIQDDGKSFDVDRMWHAKKGRRLGMLGMKERVEMVGGTFAVESAPGRGTTVCAQVPFKNRAKEPERP